MIAERPSRHERGGRDAALLARIERMDGSPVSRGLWERYRQLVLGAAGILAFLVLWQVASVSDWVDRTFVPPPTDVASEFWTLATNGQLGHHFLVSAKEFILGLGFAVVLAFALGLLIAEIRVIEELLDPLFSAAYAMPRVALLPVLVLLFGAGIASKTALVILSSFFPILINFVAGLRSADKDATLLSMSRGFGASRGQILRTIRIPTSIPFAIAGLRVGVATGVVGVVVAELYAGNEGLGYLISVGSSTLQMKSAFVGIVSVSAVAVVLMTILQGIERRLGGWSNAPAGGGR